MLLHISAAVVILGCIFQAYIFCRTKRLLNTKVGTPSASHNTGSPKLPTLIEWRKVCDINSVGEEECDGLYRWLLRWQLRASA